MKCYPVDRSWHTDSSLKNIGRIYLFGGCDGLCAMEKLLIKGDGAHIIGDNGMGTKWDGDK
jgi:hypothetical protein